MTSRELMKRTLEFDSPSRVPRNLWYLPWAAEHYPDELERIRRDFPDDMAGPPGVYRAYPKTEGDAHKIGTHVDAWGCTFVNRQSGVHGEVREPLIADWSDLEKLRPPEEYLTMDPEPVNAFCRSTDKFVTGGCCPRPFERLQFIRTSEHLLMDLAEQRGEFFELLDTVHQFFLKELEQWARTDVDALNFMDDWGTQHSLLISPAMWRRIFKPLYKEYIDLAHAHGKYIFMHSDGYIFDIVPDLIELGLDALNSQLFCMGVENLEQYRGQLTFWGEIDRQHILPSGTLEEVTQAVRLVKETLSADGGVIAQCEFGPGAKPDNVYQVFKAWDEQK